MKALIRIDIPDYQIGQEVSIYFKDTMMIKGVVQEPCGDAISREAADALFQRAIDSKSANLEEYWKKLIWVREHIKELPSVNPQEPKTDVLDKIRAEIEKPLHDERCFDTADAKAQYIALNWCIDIIDKYRAESEDKE